ncbi:FmdB family transcriptional regulator [Sulfuriferula sp. AH1]|uniref:FmdB family zinc ribbon protein n=1 Tax=Sulfuriferula sp. AH1 TaxID=1985873 RepID=UPI000B3B705F|nr:zinc ribbon domain-containing protein [Sulfuriferula sp. AH1]ARU30249.1 FmdB family transcriptional regulator [Sulfuriferula sp. AH1]
MPIYDYRCNNCDKTFELLVRSTTVFACPQCGSLQLEKLVSMPAPKSKIDVLRKRVRSQAAREGHFSNYKPSEIPRN